MAIDPKGIANTMRSVILDENGDHCGTTAIPLKVQGNLTVGVTESTDMFGGGKHAVGITALAVTITGIPQSIIIRSDWNNVGKLFVGKSDVNLNGANALTFLNANDTFIIDYNDTTNAYYVVADTSSQNFWKGAIL